MSSRHLVDPELLPVLDAFPPFVLTRGVLPIVRAQKAFDMPIIGGDSVAIADRTVPGPAGAPDVGVRIYRPANAPAPMPAYLHIHGGGYVIGSPAMSDYRHKPLAEKLNCLIVSVDYRLAPETVFPGAVEDCYAALTWLHGNAAELGIDPARIVIGGESAGGGLSAALALLARDRGEVKLAHQMLAYPMIDDRTAARPRHPVAGEFVWTYDANQFGWSCLLGHEPGRAGVSPYAAAARAENLAGLPPVFMSTSALDLFIDENLDYARRLIAAGVPTELHVYPGAFHGFEMARESRVAQQAARDFDAALARALHPAGR